MTASGSDLAAASATGRLTAYPTGLAGAPNVRSVSFTASPGRPDARAARRARRRPDRLDRRADGDAGVRDGRRPAPVRSPRPPWRRRPARRRSRRPVVVGHRPPSRAARARSPRSCGARPATPLIALIALLDRGRPRRGPRPDAGPRQDADGGLSRRDARHAAPCGGPRHGGQRVAHARDPRARGRRARRGVDAAARSRRPAWRRWSPPSRSCSSAAGCS